MTGGSSLEKIGLLRAEAGAGLRELSGLLVEALGELPTLVLCWPGLEVTGSVQSVPSDAVERVERE